jgi:hypothetical protein
VTYSSRLERHRAIEAELGASSDEELLRWLASSDLEERGHAGLGMPRSQAKVFVKLLPLTALELEHPRSTANLFQLPLHYQYRLGSCGFGAWRELAVHGATNEWVLAGECGSFPLLHGWRVLPLVCRDHGDKLDMTLWGDDPAIQRRVTAVREATSSAALFLEHFPHTLTQRLQERLKSERDPSKLAHETEASLLSLLEFTASRGLLHMDAHFENVLVAGDQLVLADHGLAISRDFPLVSDELAFFDRHETFDRCTALTSLVHALTTHLDARSDWRQALRELIEGGRPHPLRAYLERRGPVALAMGEFYGNLIRDFATEYPADDLRALLGP